MSKAELKQISPTQASEMIHEEANVLFVDVRSSMEFLFIGHPVGAVNIP